MEPVANNPNHDSGDASLYNVAPIPRNSHPLGLIDSKDREENMRRMLEEERRGQMGDSYLTVNNEGSNDEDFDL